MSPNVAMSQEVELKLELTDKSAEALLQSGILPGEPRIVPQHAIYFDTPKRRLEKAGFSLRIRRSGRKRVQTIKAGGSGAGLYARSEWERPVSGNSPIIDATTPLAELLGGDLADLAPIFEIRSVRRLWMVEEGDALIELVLDRGQANCGTQSAPVCEIELELKKGGPDALFALARRIDAISPLRLGVQTKAERGYRLLDRGASAARAQPIALTGTMTVEAAFLAIVDDCLRQFRLNEALVLSDRDADALHQARVALRRLRSALSLFRPMFGEAARVFPGEPLQSLSNNFGLARDLDVLLVRAASSALRGKIASAREGAYDELSRVLCANETRIFLLHLAQWLHVGEWRSDPATESIRQQPVSEFAANALDRLRRKVKKSGRHLVDTDDEARHELRKKAKKLRYGAEFFSHVFGGKHERKQHKKFLRALKDLQEELGLLNDLASTASVLRQVGLLDHPDAQALFAPDRKTDALTSARSSFETLIQATRFWKSGGKKRKTAGL